MEEGKEGCEEGKHPNLLHQDSARPFLDVLAPARQRQREGLRDTADRDREMLNTFKYEPIYIYR